MYGYSEDAWIFTKEKIDIIRGNQAGSPRGLATSSFCVFSCFNILIPLSFCFSFCFSHFGAFLISISNTPYSGGQFDTQKIKVMRIWGVWFFSARLPTSPKCRRGWTPGRLAMQAVYAGPLRTLGGPGYTRCLSNVQGGSGASGFCLFYF